MRLVTSFLSPLLCLLFLGAARPGSAQTPPPDARVAVPMTRAQSLQQLQNMRDFMSATQDLIGAIASDDFSKAEAAALRMSYTPEREKKARAMSGGVDPFVELAVKFFKSADVIAAAARNRDAKATLRALETTLVHCNACHAGYRQAINAAR